MAETRHQFTDHGKPAIAIDKERNLLEIKRPVQFQGKEDEKRTEVYDVLSYHKCPICKGDVRIVLMDKNPTPFRQWMIESALNHEMFHYWTKSHMVDGTNIVTGITWRHIIGEPCGEVIAALFPRGGFAALTAILQPGRWSAAEARRTGRTLEKLKTANMHKLNAKLLESSLVKPPYNFIAIAQDQISSPYSEPLVLVFPDHVVRYRATTMQQTEMLVKACQKA